MRAARRILLGVGVALAAACALAAPSGAAGATCTSVPSNAVVSGPTNAVAWRVGIETQTAVFSSPSGKRMHVTRWLTPTEAESLLVVAPARAARGRCWLRVRLPWRPNGSAGWINAGKVLLQPTSWRIVVSPAHRTLTLFRAG